MFESILTEIVEKAAFFEKDRVLWMGDFNVALDPELDTTTTFIMLQMLELVKGKFCRPSLLIMNLLMYGEPLILKLLVTQFELLFQKAVQF